MQRGRHFLDAVFPFGRPSACSLSHPSSSVSGIKIGNRLLLPVRVPTNRATGYRHAAKKSNCSRKALVLKRISFKKHSTFRNLYSSWKILGASSRRGWWRAIKWRPHNCHPTVFRSYRFLPTAKKGVVQRRRETAENCSTFAAHALARSRHAQARVSESRIF